MKFMEPGIALCLSLAGYIVCGAATAARPERPALAVGWHDEMNDLTGWRPLGGENEPDVFAARPGAMTLRLPHAPEGFPHPYQWGGVTRRASVDLGRYPVLVAYVSRVQDGSYAHLDLENSDYAGRPSAGAGRPAAPPLWSLRTPTLQGRGLIVLDVGRAWGPRTRRFHLRLIVGGPLSGASCEYAWVRFVRREDVPKLQTRSSGHQVTLEP